MVNVKGQTKEKLTVKQYGEATCQCAFSAHANAILAFFIGGGTIHLSMHLLKPIFFIRPEARFLITITSSITIGIYTAKVLRERCDQKLEERYDLVNLIR